MEQGESHALPCSCTHCLSFAAAQSWDLYGTTGPPVIMLVWIRRLSYLYYNTYSQFNINLGTRLAVSTPSRVRQLGSAVQHCADMLQHAGSLHAEHGSL